MLHDKKWPSPELRPTLTLLAARLLELPLRFSTEGTWVRSSGRSFKPTSRRAERPQAVIVLGTPPDPRGFLTPLGEERARAGLEAWKRSGAPVLCITGGRGPSATHPGTEADVMAEWLRREGVPETAILLEIQARNTYENAHRCAELFRDRRVRDVWVVTHPPHLARALFWFRRARFRTHGIAVPESLYLADPSRYLKAVVEEYRAWGRVLTVAVQRWRTGESGGS